MQQYSSSSPPLFGSAGSVGISPISMDMSSPPFPQFNLASPQLSPRTSPQMSPRRGKCCQGSGMMLTQMPGVRGQSSVFEDRPIQSFQGQNDGMMLTQRPGVPGHSVYLPSLRGQSSVFEDRPIQSFQGSGMMLTQVPSLQDQSLQLPLLQGQPSVLEVQPLLSQSGQNLGMSPIQTLMQPPQTQLGMNLSPLSEGYSALYGTSSPGTLSSLSQLSPQRTGQQQQQLQSLGLERFSPGTQAFLQRVQGQMPGGQFSPGTMSVLGRAGQGSQLGGVGQTQQEASGMMQSQQGLLSQQNLAQGSQQAYSSQLSRQGSGLGLQGLESLQLGSPRSSMQGSPRLSRQTSSGNLPSLGQVSLQQSSGRRSQQSLLGTSQLGPGSTQQQASAMQNLGQVSPRRSSSRTNLSPGFLATGRFQGYGNKRMTKGNLIL